MMGFFFLSCVVVCWFIVFLFVVAFSNCDALTFHIISVVRHLRPNVHNPPQPTLYNSLLPYTYLSLTVKKPMFSSCSL